MINYILVKNNDLKDGFKGLKYFIYNSYNNLSNSKINIIYLKAFSLLLGLSIPYLYYIYYWFILGVISSIGLGFGVHTGALFLYPKLIKETLYVGDWYIGWINILPYSLSWGIGSAIGELPPYYAGKSLMKKIKEKYSENSKFQTIYYYTELYIKKYPFLIIFSLSCWPNLFLDYVGITCGAINIPINTFLSAIILGKGLVKTPIQTALISMSAIKGSEIINNDYNNSILDNSILDNSILDNSILDDSNEYSYIHFFKEYIHFFQEYIHLLTYILFILMLLPIISVFGEWGRDKLKHQ
jgi:membrane protein YqaA with SNARE-associated domain